MKEVYDPKEHLRADEKLHEKDAGLKAKKEKEKKEKAPKAPKTPYINKYGFLHVDKNLAQHLGIELGKDKADVGVTIELIEGGFVVKLR